MASRPVIIASLLGASIGVPYFAGLPWSSDKRAANTPSAPLPASLPASSLAPIARPSPTVGPLTATPAEGPRFTSVDQFLRFDLTQDWVYRQWSRKSTGPTDVGLFSVRVPLVMGTHRAALAGSLTYFFNSYGQIEHISFHGRSADTTQLVRFLMRTYEFQRVESPVGEQVYQVTRRGRAQSELRTRTEPVVDSSSPHRGIVIELELARPGSRRFLPPRGPFLNVPQAGAPAPAPATTESAAASSQSNGASYLDKVRYANPSERDQFLWKRWPN